MKRQSASKRFLSGRRLTIFAACIVSLFAFALGSNQIALAASPQAVAFDMVGTASQNLTSFVNSAPTFGSPGDCFGKVQRPNGPFAVLDDSLSIFTGDTQGIITEGNTDEFFCIVDTENGDNAGPVSASWTFDVNGFENLELALDMGAMGDFEASSDFFTIEAAIDAGAAEVVFANTIDEAASQTYTLEGGASVTLNDPMLVDGVLLNNTLQTFTKSLSGSGSQLVLTITAQADGGSEAVAFQNLIVSGTPIGPQIVAFDMVGTTSQNLTSFVNSAPTFGSPGDCFGKVQRPNGPFAVLDDSLSIFTGDTQGIITEGNTDEFFCIVDTENGDNAGPVSASWTFDVNGFENLELALDMGAMGDFEASSDFFTIEAAIDAGAAEVVFANTIDEAASQTYTLEGGASVTLNDPMLVDGVLLNNTLQTFTKSLSGSGSQLVLTITAQADGGSEAVAFQNLIVTGSGGSGGGGPTPGDLVINEIMQNPSAVFDSAGEYFELFNSSAADIDLNGWTISDNDSDTHVISQSVIVPAGGYVVLGVNADQSANGGVPVAYQYSGYFLSNGADEVVLTDPNGVEFDRVEYDNGATYPDPNGASMQLKETTLDNNDGANWCIAVTPFGAGDLGTPGTKNICQEDIPLNCEDDYAFTLISGVQGSGATTPLFGQEVIIEGIVVGDFQASDADATDLAGFYVQEEDAQADADPATSEGIFIFDLGSPVNVNAGDLVRLRGFVGEFQDQTQINATSGAVVVCGSGAVAPTSISFPLPNGQADLEQYEGMLVTTANPMTVIEYFNLDRFGTVDVATERLEQPTDAADPGPVSDAVLAYNEARRIRLDDGSQNQNPFPVTLPDGQLDYADAFGGGDTLSNIVGVLSWIRPWTSTSPDRYAIQLTQLPTFTDTNPRPASPPAVGGTFKAVGFNVLNYFNGDGLGGGFPTSRGADDLAEFQKQTDKIVAALAALDADVVGLVEIENDFADGANSAIADLVDALNAATAPGTYAYVDPGVNVGTDAITVAIIYKPGTATPVGSLGILDSQDFVNPFDAATDRNRPALAQSFMDANGGTFTAVVNHLKSKGSSCGDGDDDPRQGSCNGTRSAAAQVLVDWLATDPTVSGDPDVLLLGDYNAYAQEDPIDVLVNAGFVDLFSLLQPDDVYSYVFDGQTGYLDYGLASPSLVSQVTGAAPWNINSDEPDAYEYNEDFDNSANLPLWYAPTAYRSSDHDPVVVGLNLNAAPPICDGAMPSVAVLWPPNHQMVAIDVLGVIDPDGDPVTITITGIFQDEPVNDGGDGDTAPDGEGVGTGTAWVRAERDGGGNGRVYHIYFTATDGFGNSCDGEIVVSVPKSQGKKGAAVDDGPLFDSTLID